MNQKQLAKLVDLDESSVSKYVTDFAPLPLDHLKTWNDALGLAGEASVDFRIAVFLGRAPEEVRDLVVRLDLELAKARADMHLYEVRIEAVVQAAEALNAVWKRRMSQQEPKPPAT